MTVGIITAMEKEFRQIERALERAHSENVFQVLCGIGKVNAAASAQSLVDYHHPDCIISAGVSGGLKDFLHQGDIVIGESLAYHDVWCGDGNQYGQVQDLPLHFHSDPSLIRKAVRLKTLRPGQAIHTGLVCTGDKFSDGSDVLSNINTHFPDALAVDMESAAVAQVCHLNKVPFISFRIISNLSFSAESCGQYEQFWESEADSSFAVFSNLIERLIKQ